MDTESSSPPPPLRRRAQLYRALGEPHRLAIVEALQLSDRSPSELAALAGLGSNLAAFHLNVLDEAGVIERLASEGDARRRYIRLHRDVTTVLRPPADLTLDDVLFVCTHNSARSQLAAALWERTTGRPARSAGHEPSAQIHHLAVAVAADHGLDLSTRRPQGFDALGEREPDLVVSVCDRVREAGWPFSAPSLHWSIPDPVTGDRQLFEAAYGLLADRIDTLAAVAWVA